MNYDRLISQLNKLERWLKETKGDYHLYPLRIPGYLLLWTVMIISNLLAMIRWPVHSLIKVFQTSEPNAGVTIHNNRPNEADTASLNEILRNQSTVLVDFWAAWCGPCIMMNKPLKKIASSEEINCIIAKVDTVKHPQLAERYDIKGLPTVILFEDGKEIKRYAGALSYPELKEFIRV